MCAQSFTPIHWTDAELFHWISNNFDLLLAQEEKSGDPRSHKKSSSGEHECQHQISCQSIQQLLRYFGLDQPADRHPQSPAPGHALLLHCWRNQSPSSPAVVPGLQKWLLALVSGSGATLFRSVWDMAGFSCSGGPRRIVLQQLREVLAHKDLLCLKRPLSVHQHQLTPTALNHSYKPPLYTSTTHTQRHVHSHTYRKIHMNLRSEV